MHTHTYNIPAFGDSSRGCTGEMAKIFFSSNNHETCQSCRDCLADHLSSRYKKKILTGRSSFSAQRLEKFLSSYLYAIYPKNETLSLVDPVPPKARI